MDIALGSSVALASIFSTPKQDIADVREAAKLSGLHTGLMRSPGARSDGKSTINEFGKRENSWWVVMGKNAEAVKHLVNSQQKGMPGFYHPEKESDEVRASTQAAQVGFFQMVVAGAIGGAAVAFGLARLL